MDALKLLDLRRGSAESAIVLKASNAAFNGACDCCDCADCSCDCVN